MRLGSRDGKVTGLIMFEYGLESLFPLKETGVRQGEQESLSQTTESSRWRGSMMRPALPCSTTSMLMEQSGMTLPAITRNGLSVRTVMHSWNLQEQQVLNMLQESNFSIVLVVCYLLYKTRKYEIYF